MNAQTEEPERPTEADFAHPTPGPWRARTPTISGETLPFYWYIEGGDGVGNETLGYRGFHASGYMNGADARLMAAAPDLLAVVRKVAEHFADTDAPLGEAARAAIAKAQSA